MQGEILLKCSGICKSFGPTRALVDVDFEVRRGEIHGLIGENGSGKSTLTSIIAGAQRADAGTMYVRDQAYNPKTVIDGQNNGVGMVVQEMGTLSTISVAENIFAGNLNRFTKAGFLNTGKMHSEAQAILQKIGAPEILPEAHTAMYNFEDRKIIEIARIMYLEPDILIVDETTTALAQKGRGIIYKLMRGMQAENKAVIFISHDLDELMDICNIVTVLRDGHKIATLAQDEITIPAMRHLMVGREMTDHYYRNDFDGSYDPEIVLKAERVTSVDGMIMNLNLELHRGEILGLGGLANCGMHELGQMLYGIQKCATGKVTHTVSEQEIRRPSDAVKCKIGYVSKNRDMESLVLTASIRDNIALPSLDALSKKLIISGKRERALSTDQIKALSIKCVDENQSCNQLSGGNKQKVALGKWLANDCDIFIIDCPTRGIDIGVKSAFYSIMYQLKQQGKSILMISEELVELIGMSDRMLILKDGRITGEFRRDEKVTDSTLIDYMI